jgi:hypothetical protein
VLVDKQTGEIDQAPPWHIDPAFYDGLKPVGDVPDE